MRRDGQHSEQNCEKAFAPRPPSRRDASTLPVTDPICLVDTPRREIAKPGHAAVPPRAVALVGGLVLLPLVSVVPPSARGDPPLDARNQFGQRQQQQPRIEPSQAVSTGGQQQLSTATSVPARSGPRARRRSCRSGQAGHAARPDAPAREQEPDHVRLVLCAAPPASRASDPPLGPQDGRPATAPVGPPGRARRRNGRDASGRSRARGD